MDVVDPTLGSSHMQAAAVEVNLVPSQPAHFRGAQPVTVRDQDHGGVAVPVAGPLAGGFLGCSISFSVRYSLGRSSELGDLRGTVRFTMVEGVHLRADFIM